MGTVKGGFEEGSDVGVIAIPDSLKNALGKSPKCVVVDPNVMKSQKLKAADITISGYPVEAHGKYTQDQYYHKGKILKEGHYPAQPNSQIPYFVDCNDVSDGKVCYYNVQTTGGQSGSALVKSSQTQQSWMVVGVHDIGTNTNNGGTVLRSTALDFLQSRKTSHAVSL